MEWSARQALSQGKACFNASSTPCSALKSWPFNSGFGDPLLDLKPLAPESGQHTAQAGQPWTHRQKLDHQPAAGNQPSGRDFVRTLDLAASTGPQRRQQPPIIKSRTTLDNKNPSSSNAEESVRVRSRQRQQRSLAAEETEDGMITGLPIRVIRESRLVLNSGRPKDAEFELAEYGDT